jgi:hypothetical protein
MSKNLVAKGTDAHLTFIRNMKGHGYEVRYYVGRNFWRGPAVVVDRAEFHDVIRATFIDLQTDEMGKSDIIVYPKDYHTSALGEAEYKTFIEKTIAEWESHVK